MKTEPGKVVVVDSIPPCDFCVHEGRTPTELGIYDFATTFGSWANGCERHWRMYRAAPTLGVGKGQRWITAEEVSDG